MSKIGAHNYVDMLNIKRSKVDSRLNIAGMTRVGVSFPKSCVGNPGVDERQRHDINSRKSTLIKYFSISIFHVLDTNDIK